MNGKSILRRLLCIFCAAFFLAGMPLRAGAAEADPAQTLMKILRIHALSHRYLPPFIYAK